MKDSVSQFTLRKLRVPFAGFAMALAVLVLTVSGPFGTIDQLGLGMRALYWGCVVPLTYGAGVLMHNLVFDRLRPDDPIGLRIAITAVITGLVISAVVIALNWLFFGLTPGVHAGQGQILTSIFAVACAISAGLLAYHKTRPADTVQPITRTPALLDRIPLDKRGPLISLSVADHYVEITTTKGAALLLMRLSDAIRETEGTTGMQIHRSHWVALDQIARAERRGDKAALFLRDGRELPASRTYVKALKEAGVLV